MAPVRQTEEGDDETGIFLAVVEVDIIRMSANYIGVSALQESVL